LFISNASNSLIRIQQHVTIVITFVNNFYKRFTGTIVCFFSFWGGHSHLAKSDILAVLFFVIPISGWMKNESLVPWRIFKSLTYSRIKFSSCMFTIKCFSELMKRYNLLKNILKACLNAAFQLFFRLIEISLDSEKFWTKEFLELFRVVLDIGD